MFLLDYDVVNEETVKAEKGVIARNDGEKKVPTAYRFKFYARRSGREKVTLSFYDRTYAKNVKRVVEFKISKSEFECDYPTRIR